MNLLLNIREAITGLTANKLRSILTMLGIIIGVAAVITLLSVGRGVESFIVGEFESLGNNILFVFPGRLGPGEQPQRPGGSGLTNEDVAALSDPFLAPDVVAVVPEYVRLAAVTRGPYEARTNITGTSAEFPEVRNFYPITGAFFDDLDVNANARVVVLGQTVYETLFPDGEAPVGETVKINNSFFRVIGLMEEKGGSGFNDQDNLVLIPISTAQKRLFPARRADGQMRVDLIYAQVLSEETQDRAIVQIEQTLRDRHNIGLGDKDDFTVLSQSELASAFGQIASVITSFLSLIAGISLLVGGIGIMNIMLVSVRERTREIGLRKAVGAKQRDILWQFLIEAVVMALVGGLIGLTIGAIGVALISALSEDLSAGLAWDSVVLSISFSIAVGLFFGIYPASRAAKLDPIEALRYE